MKVIKRGILLTMLIVSFGCNEKSLLEENPCVRGKYAGSYCSGFVIKILDNSGIGKDLDLRMTNRIVKNAVLAHIDTSLAKTNAKILELFPDDSVFYFNYVPGRYPPKAYINCPPEASIIITSISLQPCNH